MKAIALSLTAFLLAIGPAAHADTMRVSCTTTDRARSVLVEFSRENIQTDQTVTSTLFVWNQSRQDLDSLGANAQLKLAFGNKNEDDIRGVVVNAGRTGQLTISIGANGSGTLAGSLFYPNYQFVQPVDVNCLVMSHIGIRPAVSGSN